MLGYPLGLAFAGPLPYFLGVVIPTVVLSAAYQLSRTALVGRYEHASTVVAAVTFLGLFGVLMVTAAKPGAFLDVVGSVGIVLVATLVAVVSWATIGRLSPGMVRRIGSMGLVLFWAYLLNGLATVIRAEWATELGFRAPEQVSGLVILVANLAGAVLPTSLASMTRVAWPFVVLQVGVALFVASSFDRDIVRDDDLAVLLLLAVLAVALVPAISGLLSLVFGV